MPYAQPTSLAGKPFVILGAGTLGRRIALMWLTQGEIVHLFDPNAKALQDAATFIAENITDVISARVENGKPGTLKTFQDRTAAVENAWIVVEVVPEILSLKIDLLGELDALLPNDCILASNSSSYTGSEMFDKVKNKARLVNTHYYMPPNVLPLEVMPNPYTDPAIVSLLLKEGARHGLRMYHVRKESVGLLFNRIWAAIKREALYVVAQDVAGPTEVDGIMKDVLGVHRGVFEMLDGVGLDVALDIETHYAQVRAGQIPPEPAALLQSMVAKGELGVKTGKGFYVHPPHQAIAGKDHIVFLDIIKGEIRSLSIDGREGKTLVSGLRSLPDGVQIDTRPGKGHIYWTNMGTKANDGFLSRSNLDGSEITTIVAPGQTHTPKQLVLDVNGEHLYWADREGGRIQRCSLDGSNLETLYVSALTPEQHSDQRTWCVGIAIDTERRLLYWTQKGGSKGYKGRIFRAAYDQLAGGQPAIEVLFDGLPEPIDLELHGSWLYWTDRGDPPFGNSLNRADVSAPFDQSRPPRGPSADLVIAERFHETIGLTIDDIGKKVYISDLLGSLWVTELDGSNKTAILTDAGNFSGITFHRSA
ncbi:3-hydroxyacyl-CoA dehydrogenase [Mycena indigotica]|uniref:3-hydroxyacyl-CoA dehydrogenase n=1 Tax=Mycena indigotica TaxID=2126181 RepID=A0A8H6SBD2_9AGAR|nr:3-hydroxyacyl-CoA dehydrogenase [Mycena indigotica]KAF7295212.1 3-hydroxyacyl-CoA dehydrogenase [Mycena indigotica]